MGWKYLLYDVSHFVLACEYIVLIFFPCAALYRAPQKWPLTPQIWFYLCFIFGSIGRMTFFIMSPFVYEGNLVIPLTPRLLWNTLPSFFYLTGFSIVLALWAEIYHNPKGRRAGESFTIDLMYMPLILFNSVLYIVASIFYTTIFIVIGFTGDETQTVPTNNTSRLPFFQITFVYFVLGILFAIYGYLIVRQLRGNLSRTSLMWKVGVIASICAVAFEVRGAITIFTSFIPEQYMSEDLWFIDIVYYTLLEVLPLSCMLLILMLQTPIKEERRALLNSRTYSSSPLTPGQNGGSSKRVLI